MFWRKFDVEYWAFDGGRTMKSVRGRDIDHAVLRVHGSRHGWDGAHIFDGTKWVSLTFAT